MGLEQNASTSKSSWTSSLNLTITTSTNDLTTSSNNSTINISQDDVWGDVLSVRDEVFISDEMLADFMAVFRWMMPLLCTLAVTFCVFNAAVYWQQRAGRFALYLVAVDLGDGLCSLVELLHSLVAFALPSDSYGHLVVKWYLAKYVAASCRRAAVCLNAFASLERFLAIAFPLKSVSRRVCAHPSVIIATVFAASLVAHVYFALEYEVSRNEAGDWSLSHTALKLSHPEAFALWSLVDSIVFAYSPLVAIMVLNTTLLVVLQAHASSLKTVRRVRGNETKKNSPSCNPEDNTSLVTVSAQVERSKFGQDKFSDNKTEKRQTRQKENQTTRMVMVFSTVVLAMALPRMLNSTARAILPDYGPKGKETNLYNAVSLLSQITSHFTETALFWVGLAYSRNFRRAVFRLPVARWLCGRWLVKTSLPASSSGDVTTSTMGSGYLPQ